LNHSPRSESVETGELQSPNENNPGTTRHYYPRSVVEWKGKCKDTEKKNPKNSVTPCLSG